MYAIRSYYAAVEVVRTGDHLLQPAHFDRLGRGFFEFRPNRFEALLRGGFFGFRGEEGDNDEYEEDGEEQGDQSDQEFANLLPGRPRRGGLLPRATSYNFV